MLEQLLVVGLGIGEDADAAWLLSGLALEDDALPTYGLVSTTGYVTSNTAVASGAPATSVVSHQTATTAVDGSQ